ncbi:Truncated IS1081 transposase (part1) [Mycobacterium canettii CIPT 140070008]|nr:Truncated IS1081 transposase (part1) [Mycobacterium canettii CIPT 140070008]
MTSSHLIDTEQLLADQLAQASPDLLRGLLSTFIAALMGAEADALCGAGYRERSDERSNQRNGYRHRDFDTRAATIDVAIPKLRQGSYFPDWLLQRRKRAERALTSVVATCYLLGVSTRRMERLVETLGVTKLSKSHVSIMAKELDEAVEAFRDPPARCRPVYLPRRRRPGAQGARGRPRRRSAHLDRHRRQRRGLPRDPGHPGHLRRGRGRLAGVLPRPGRPRPVRGRAGHQRRPRRPGGRDRRHPARSGLAALQNPLRSQSRSTQCITSTYC